MLPNLCKTRYKYLISCLHHFAIGVRLVKYHAIYNDRVKLELVIRRTGSYDQVNERQ